jgi:hypothetical protein
MTVLALPGRFGSAFRVDPLRRNAALAGMPGFTSLKTAEAARTAALGN